MRIRNNYGEKIYWRAFKGSDTDYVVGLKQGSVDTGGTDSWRDDSFPSIKVEVKTGDIVFSKKVLAWAGPIYDIKDDLVVTSNGDLVVAKVDMQASGKQRIEQRSDVQFVDLRNFSNPVERTMTSRVQQAFSQTAGLARSEGKEDVWTVGGKIGGMIGKKDEANASAEISGSFQEKMVKSLQETSSQTVSSVWEQSWSDKFTFKPGKIHVVEVVWSLTLAEGSAAYLNEKASYSVVTAASAKVLRPSEFDSPESLPESYRKAWDSVQ